MGLGSAALANWVQTNRWLFLVITLTMLALALYSANKDRQQGNTRGLLLFGAALLLCIGVVINGEF